MTKVVVMIPTKNEEQGIKETILGVKQKITPDNIIVVDANSTDNTAKIAKEEGAEVLLQNGVGKGAGIITFIEKTKKYPGDTVVVMTDADSTYGLDNVKSQFPLTKEYGMLVGSRFKGKIEKGALKLLNMLGNYFFSFLVTALLKTKVSDVLTGLRVFRLDVLRKMNLKVQGFDIETEMTVKCIKNKLGYIEFPCDYYNRKGKSNLRPFQDGWVILKRIFKEVFSKKV